MESIKVSIEVDADEVLLFPIGDFHVGTIFHADYALEQHINYVLGSATNTPILVVGMGDYAECITPTDERWDDATVAPWVLRHDIGPSQLGRVVDKLAPIKPYLVGLVLGNHENKLRQTSHYDFQAHLAEALDTRNLGYSAFVRLEITHPKGIRVFDCRFEHGSGSAQTEGAKLNRLIRGMNAFRADIYAMGHVHDVKIANLIELYQDDKLRIAAHNRAGAITGSWFRGYYKSVAPSYVELKGYPPTVMGAPVFRLELNTGLAVAESGRIWV